MPRASSHEHATGVVKDRMDLMTDMGKRMKAIRAHLREAHDLSTIKADADAIGEQASHIAHLFPEGSLNSPTRARKTI